MSPLSNTSKQLVPNLLLISGSGRNSGKTTLVCEIIKNISSTKAVYALKISPHFHKLSEKQELLDQQKGFKIFREKDQCSNKDSSRMLRAGAADALYIQCDDLHVAAAFQNVWQLIPKNAPVVCESGSLVKYFKPGLFLLVHHVKNEEIKNAFLRNKQLADHVIDFDGVNFSINVQQLAYDAMMWRFENNNIIP